MFTPFSSRAFASAFLSLSCLVAAPARASSLVTFVSGKGTDTGVCATPATPCRSFKFAITQTSPGGKIQALDPANYGGVIITKSISIAGVEGAGIDRSARNAITINAGPNDVVNLGHLIVDGRGTASRGIELNSGGSLTITQCTVRNFSSAGIIIEPAAATTFLIGNTLVSDSARGIFVVPQAHGSAQGTLDQVSMNHNGEFGLEAGGAADVTVVDSIASNNAGSGFLVAGGVIRLARSAATGNGIGVDKAFGAAESFGNNVIRGNGTDVSGTLIPVATQ